MATSVDVPKQAAVWTACLCDQRHRFGDHHSMTSGAPIVSAGCALQSDDNWCEFLLSASCKIISLG